VTLPIPVELLPFVKAVETRLSTLTSASGYLGEAGDVPRLDSAGHVGRYWVLHPFAGTPFTDADLAETYVDIDWTFQLTLAAGFARDVVGLLDVVRPLFHRWAPAVDGYVAGFCEPPPGFDPGPVRLDRDVKPFRPFLPLQYRTTITRSS
jgi:hypothetical protein